MKPILLGSLDICYYCEHQFPLSEKKKKKIDKHLPTGSLTINHVIPVSRRKKCKSTPLKNMYVCLCLGCNTSRGNLLLSEFVDKLNEKNLQGKRLGKIKHGMIPTVMQNVSELLSWIYITNFA